MKKIALAFGLLGLSALANAADPLNGTVWKTIDDKTGKFRLSHRVLEEKPEGWEERPARRPRREGGEGGHAPRRPRRD